MPSSRVFFSLLILIAVPALAAVISQTVGALGDRVYTSREVMISATIEKVLTGAPNAGPVDLSVASPEFDKEVSTLLLEAAIAKEAESFSLGKIDKPELDAAREKVEKAVEGKKIWTAWQVSREELEKLLVQKMAAKNFARMKRESMTSVVSDAEAQDYFEKNRSKFGSSLPFSSFKDNIKSFLSQQQLEERMRSWSEIIKRKHHVRVYLEDEKAPGGKSPAKPATGG